jgi:hypothetical protein
MANPSKYAEAKIADQSSVPSFGVKSWPTDRTAQDSDNWPQVAVGHRFNPYRRFPGILIPEPLCQYRGISPGAKLVYGRLCRYAGEKGTVFPSAARLAEEVGMSARQAREYVQELERGKFIEVDRENKHYRKDGGGGTNTYYFLWHKAFEGDRGVPRNSPPPRQSTARAPRQSAAAFTPARTADKESQSV